MKKILLVIPTLQQGGAERVITELANEWARLGHMVSLVTLIKSDVFYDLHPNVNLIQLEFDNRTKKILDFFKLLFNLRKQIKTLNPDFVLSFLDRYNILTLVATRFLDIDVFVSDRANPYEYVPKPVVVGRFLFYRFAKGIIAQTSLAKDFLTKKLNHSNIQVIPNPVKAIHKSKNIVRENIILNVGRLVREKGQHYLIEMMSKLNIDNWKLVILGDGPLRESLEKQIVDLSVQDRVILQGTVTNVEEWLHKSSIFAFSSVSEGFPNALVEAMAAGLPCVSFDCDAGPRDIIDDGKNAFLIPLGDIDAFTSAVQKCIQDQSIREQLSFQASIIGEELNVVSIAGKYLQFCIGK
ncbi:MAG: glycosyltransferase family 4 protein [Limnohabitans sp.]|nr:glycosyltransferase family 4 protein [Limnohabitans sp.]